MPRGGGGEGGREGGREGEGGDGECSGIGSIIVDIEVGDA